MNYELALETMMEPLFGVGIGLKIDFYFHADDENNYPGNRAKRETDPINLHAAPYAQEIVRVDFNIDPILSKILRHNMRTEFYPTKVKAFNSIHQQWIIGRDIVNAFTDVELAQRFARSLEDSEARSVGVSVQRAREIVARHISASPGFLENLRR